ncbi:MAG TPA: SRPBCC family protein [Candidatus Didemnitutus sp.]|nr:SRPBCC family protein [Candidatus Didemnitutus sp.]
MAVIELETVIDAPLERVFDLARSIDAHQDSTTGTSERAVEGVTSGLLGPDEEVTWEARHLGVTQRLRVKMTRFDRPRHFQDVMLKGTFSHMQHDHRFEGRDGRTLMIDRFEFQSPLGLLGRMVDRLFLAGYMRRFIVKRNAILKQTAESEAWKKYLKTPGHSPEPIPQSRDGSS